MFEWTPVHWIFDEEIFIPDNNQNMEDEHEEEILNRKNGEIEGENIKIYNAEDGISITDTDDTENDNREESGEDPIYTENNSVW